MNFNNAPLTLVILLYNILTVLSTVCTCAEQPNQRACRSYLCIIIIIIIIIIIYLVNLHQKGK